MRAYVITILQNKKSVEAAERCISSAARHGLAVEKFPAFIIIDDKGNDFYNI